MIKRSCKWIWPSQISAAQLETSCKIINLNEKSNKTDFMSFNQDRAISSLNVKSLKLLVDFTYFGSHVSSTESYVNMRIGDIIERSMAIGKSDLWLDKTKILPRCSFVTTTVWLHYIDIRNARRNS